jgi:hypothetical protein
VKEDFICTYCRKDLEVELIPEPDVGDRGRKRFTVPKHRVPEASRTWAKLGKLSHRRQRDRGVDVYKVCPLSEAEVFVVI